MKVLNFLIITILFLALPLAAESNFKTPEKLRPRVNFWIDVFTKYGKHQAVVHHREFPQAVFEVLDFSASAETLSEPALAKHIEFKKKEAIKRVTQILKKFDQGESPANAYEQRIYDAMKLVPWGRDKYSRTVKEDLVRTQTGIKEKYREAVIRSGRYLPVIERIFREEFRLPVELTRLPFVESSFDYTAYSSVGAAGIWQFMPRTAKSYKLTVTPLVDERRDVIAASRAAAKYMQDAFESLGNWPLAITSYNHGVTGVYRKTKEAGTNNLTEIIESPDKRYFGFASGNFYPEFLAALEVYKDPQKYFPGVHLEDPLSVTEYRLPYAASIQHIESRLRISKEELQNYNYALGKAVWNGNYKIPSGYNLKIPSAHAGSLIALGAPEPSSGSSSVVLGVGTYRVRAGDTLSFVAASHGLSIADLKKLNNLKGNTIRVGQDLIVNRTQNSTKSASAKTPVASVSSAKTYKVNSGDNLWLIARRSNVSVNELKRINNLTANSIKAGQVLKIP